MALQVWLPLNGNTKNQGLANITTSASGLTTVDGKLGSGYRFDNGSQSGAGISINSNLLDILGSKNSIAVWIKPYGNHVHYNGTILSSGNWNGSCWAFGVSQDNTQVDLFGNSYNTYINCSVPVNTWTHLACINDGTTAYLYKNGEYVGSSAVASISKSDATNTYVGRETYAGGYFGFNGAIQDLRVYNHCLSAKEVKEIAKGLVLHYKMDDGCLKTTNNLVTGLTGGGQCTISNNTVTISGSNSDTYFYLNTSAALTSGKTYKISCVGHFDNGKYYYFPIGGQTNTSPGQLLVKNGYCSLVFTANSTIQNNDTRIIMDDTSRSPGAGTITNIILEEINGICDCSGFGYNGTITSTTAPITDSDSPRYNSCLNFDTTGKYILCPAINFSGMTSSYSFSWWGKTPSWDCGLMYWGFTDGNRLNYYSGYYWNTGDGGDNPFYSSGTTTISRPSVNAWHHYVVTGDGSYSRLYVDGSLYGTAKTNRNLTGTQICIHGWDTSANYKNAGDKISDFRIYATTLSVTDIKDLYSTSAAVCDNGTVMAYSLEE